MAQRDGTVPGNPQSVLQDTLRSLRELIHEVDSDELPVEAVLPPGTRRTGAPVGQVEKRRRQLTAETGEPPRDEDGRPLVKWYTGPQPILRDPAPEPELDIDPDALIDDGDDIPELCEIADLPDRHRPGTAARARVATVDGDNAPVALGSQAIEDITEKLVQILDAELLERSGFSLDDATHQELREQLGAVLRGWSARLDASR